MIALAPKLLTIINVLAQVFSPLVNEKTANIFQGSNAKKIIKLEEQLEQMKIEMDKNKPLHLKVYDGIIKLFEKYPKLLTAFGTILTPALIYKLSKNMLGTKVASPPKSIVKLMKMYLKKAS